MGKVSTRVLYSIHDLLTTSLIWTVHRRRNQGARCAIAPPLFLLTIDLDTILFAELLS